ncbi:MAG: phosphohydrolase, partial [Lachnospiraceae bacterium]|nr:phosphohydrolase [Lachnospiraceae bacterium]
HNLHGFFHPGRALRNAKKEYRLTKRQADIIKKHMWPLTVVPPMCREAWIVTTADKYCSLMETLYIHEGRARNKRKKRRSVRAA